MNKIETITLIVKQIIISVFQIFFVVTTFLFYIYKIAPIIKSDSDINPFEGYITSALMLIGLFIISLNIFYLVTILYSYVVQPIFKKTQKNKKIIKLFDKPTESIKTQVKIKSSDNSAEYENATAIWDTGAIFSGISRKMVEKLKLVPVDNGVTYTTMGNYVNKIYLIDLYINQDIQLKQVKVADCLNCPGFDFIIGMDVLNRGNFQIKPKQDKTEFSFKM